MKIFCAPSLLSGYWIVSYRFGIILAASSLLHSMSSPICTQKFCASMLGSANMKLNFPGSMYVVKSPMSLPSFSYLLFSVINISFVCIAKFPYVLFTLVM